MVLGPVDTRARYLSSATSTAPQRYTGPRLREGEIHAPGDAGARPHATRPGPFGSRVRAATIAGVRLLRWLGRTVLAVIWLAAWFVFLTIFFLAWELLPIWWPHVLPYIQPLLPR